ncbi:MAG: hypothetical protein IT364_03720 [Candidatus Hydrogenedentes bacterium]|nr:hypothetical protein [Candidatus Hydrogenedentota bacterium]
MKHKDWQYGIRLLSGFCILCLAVPGAWSDKPGGGKGGSQGGRHGSHGSAVVQMRANDQAVKFQQVDWNLELAQLRQSDWGQICVDPAALQRRLRNWDEVYLNVFLYDPNSGTPVWAIENLPVHPENCAGRSSVPSGSGKSHANDRDSQSIPPVCRFFDLRPSEEVFSGRVERLRCSVLASVQPVPPSMEMLRRLTEAYSPSWFQVKPTIENAEGFLPDPKLGTTPPRVVDPDLPLGVPPLPTTPPFEPELDLLFPLCTMQTPYPNVQCAFNQCVPMSQANVIHWLEDEYNGPFLQWDLPEIQVRGIGKVNSAGDVLFWTPEPPNSVIANVDAFTRRAGVLDHDTGSGADICQLFQGTFGYLTQVGPFVWSVNRHQGTNSDEIGDGTVCDTGFPDLGGRTSTREGLNPTWQWMFDQLSQGRGVAICFGRYDASGNRTSGHCVRVYGACRFGTKDYLYPLDEGDQGSNNSGLRTQVWEVADTGSPGNPGVPDGRLNMDGSTWEIEFANSIEAIPFVPVP